MVHPVLMAVLWTMVGVDHFRAHNHTHWNRCLYLFHFLLLLLLTLLLLLLYDTMDSNNKAKNKHSGKV